MSGSPNDLPAPLRIHAERTEHADAVDWIIRDGLLTGSGVLTAATMPVETPSPFVDLLQSGQVDRIEIHQGWLRVWRVADGTAWKELATTVNRAVNSAFAHGPWAFSAATARSADLPDDLALAAGVRDLLEGELGDYVASHGGEITLLAVTDGAVRVKLNGACRGCPGATNTLRAGIELRLRQRFPTLRSVEAQL